jgi:protein-arginine kinase activator protein McsA
MTCEHCKLRAALVYLLDGPVSENVMVALCADCAVGVEGERFRNSVDPFLMAMEQVRNVQLREPTVDDVRRIILGKSSNPPRRRIFDDAG